MNIVLLEGLEFEVHIGQCPTPTYREKMMALCLILKGGGRVVMATDLHDCQWWGKMYISLAQA